MLLICSSNGRATVIHMKYVLYGGCPAAHINPRQCHVHTVPGIMNALKCRTLGIRACVNP